jgi:acyl-coenzyme A synthetase/AMP-(fatty) acid ligase
MSESLLHLYQIMAARPAGFVVGWRANQTVSNAGFLASVARWQHLLSERTGQNFALYLDDTLEFGAALLGAWHAGKTVWLCADTLSASCAALAQRVDGFLGEFPPEYLPESSSASSKILHDAPFIPASYAPLTADFPALVVHTSGTSGVAQAIPKRLSQLSSEVATLESLFGARMGDCEILATVSHHHIYGLLFKLLWPLLSGRAIHAYSQNFPEQLASLLSLRPCALISSPAHLKRLPEHLSWEAAGQNLRAIFSSGGPLSHQAAQGTALLLGQAPLEVYGSSETGGIAWRQQECSFAPENQSWQAFPCLEWRIVTAENLLEVRSPHLADHNWLRLADRVQACDDRHFLLMGRSDRIVKLEEKRISLDAIETLLLTSELVAEVRLLACEVNASQRQGLAAFVVLSAAGRQVLIRDGKLAINQALRAVLVAAVEQVALPRRWRYLERMPTDAQGKITQALLLAALSAPTDVAEVKVELNTEVNSEVNTARHTEINTEINTNTRPRLPQVRLLERDPSRVTLEVIAPADLLYFDGHFTQMAILPGVVQLDWAISYGRQYFELAPRFKAVHALKFQQLIRADMPVTLELLFDANKGSLSFRYFSAAQQHSSGRILFSSADQA